MTSKKGKEKAMEPAEGLEDDSVTHGSTLFVSSLAYNTTSASLEAAFADIVPVRNAFVVSQKDAETGETKSKGVGFVAFAVKEDAEGVIARYGEGKGESVIVDGRKVRVQWAKKRAAHPTDDESPRKKAKTTTASSSPSSTKPGSSKDISKPRPTSPHTLVLSSLPKAADKKNLWKKLRKLSGIQSVEHPIAGSPRQAYVIFGEDESLSKALERLDESTFKGATLRAWKFGQKPAKPSASSALKSLHPNHEKAGRLIIRNLPTSITQADLETLFSPYGTIRSVTLPAPKEAPGGRKLPPRFAFVWMSAKAEADKAIKALNGIKVYPGVATKGKIKFEEDGDVKMKDVGPNEGRIVAVDFALPKDAWEEVKKETSGKVEEVKDEDEDEDMSEEDEEEDTEVEDDDDEEMKSEGDISSGSQESELDEEEDDISDDEEDEEVHMPAPEEGTTLFIRNIPFEATDEDLGDLFRSFGPLRYACITMDYETNRSRGTGFVCFWKRGAADLVIEEAERVKAATGVDATAKSKGPAPAFSLLTADPSSSFASKLVLMGRTLDVVRAVTKDEAGDLKKAAAKIREKRQDGRNLYLLREGVIFEGTPAARTVPPATVATRLKSYDQRRELLRSNPALYISQTRLSIRSLPRFATERTLKRLGLHAIKAFNEEVEKGEREGISRDELEIDEEIKRKHKEIASPAAEKKRKGKKHYSGPVKQTKIPRHKTQVDQLNPHGLGRSEGYGFLELERHTDALRILRWANNRPGVAELLWGWWKEELKEMVEREKAKPAEATEAKPKKDDDHETLGALDPKARLELWEKTLAEMESDGFTGKDKPLLVEFSIENRVVTKRREAKLKQSKEPAKPVAHKTDVLGAKRRKPDDNQETEEPAKKKQKKAKPAVKSRNKSKSVAKGVTVRRTRKGKAARKNAPQRTPKA